MGKSGGGGNGTAAVRCAGTIRRASLRGLSPQVTLSGGPTPRHSYTKTRSANTILSALHDTQTVHVSYLH